MDYKPVFFIRSESDVAIALRSERMARGMTGEDVDARLGWPDRYTAKAENPQAKWGKKLIRMHMHGDLWLQGMGLALVIMDRDEAERRALKASALHLHGNVEPVRQVVFTFA